MLHSAAIELSAGPVIPIGMRNAAWPTRRARCAYALRAVIDAHPRP